MRQARQIAAVCLQTGRISEAEEARENARKWRLPYVRRPSLR